MFDLDRFVKAQAPVIETVFRELCAGHKETHWMWFVFPQLRALGRSPIAQHYGIDDITEARAYLGHAILGPRLEKCIEAVLGVLFFDDALRHGQRAWALVQTGPRQILRRADGSCDAETVRRYRHRQIVLEDYHRSAFRWKNTMVAVQTLGAVPPWIRPTRAW